MTPLCFIDTETTGLHPDRRAWEIAMIRRDDQGEHELLIQVTDIDLSNADPMGLKVGGFYERHVNFRTTVPSKGDPSDSAFLMTERQAAAEVEGITRGAHLVGCVPDFDARTLDPMLRRHHLLPSWHYHLVDVEAMAVGWLSAHAWTPRRWISGAASADELAELAPIDPGRIVVLPNVDLEHGTLDRPDIEDLLAPPWRSDDLSRACGVEPPSKEDRHTALGDARWAMRWYDAMTGGQR